MACVRSLVAVGVVGLAVVGLDVWNRVAASPARPASLLTAETAQVPALIRDIGTYRRWIDPDLRRIVEESSDNSKAKLHASLALLPSDPTQLSYLERRLLECPPAEFSVLRDALRPHDKILTPELWSALESAGPGYPDLLPAAAALAAYDRDNPRWGDFTHKIAQALVRVNPAQFGSWLEILRPVLSKLTDPLAKIFGDKGLTETEHALAASVLVDHAQDRPDLLGNLLMDADPKAYARLFPVAEKQPDQIAVVFRDELTKEMKPSWVDAPPEPSWTKPDTALAQAIESARGLVHDRFAFCQMMAPADFSRVKDSLRKSGYRPIRFRPYGEGTSVLVAAVWTRDGRDWRIESNLPREDLRRQDEKHRSEKFIPVDVAGYVAIDGDGKPVERYAALWVEASGGR